MRKNSLTLDPEDERLLALALKRLHGTLLNNIADQVRNSRPLATYIAARERCMRISADIGHPIDDAVDMENIRAEMRRKLSADAMRGLPQEAA